MTTAPSLQSTSSADRTVFPPPVVETIEWGKIVARWAGNSYGPLRTFKDAMLAPRICREWDWAASKTHHTPGIQSVDVEVLRQCGASHIVLSTGFDGMLHVAPETMQYMDANSIPYDVLRSPEAVEVYNQLVAENVPNRGIGLLLHSTC